MWNTSGGCATKMAKWNAGFGSLTKMDHAKASDLAVVLDASFWSSVFFFFFLWDSPPEQKHTKSSSTSHICAETIFFCFFLFCSRDCQSMTSLNEDNRFHHTVNWTHCGPPNRLIASQGVFLRACTSGARVALEDRVSNTRPHGPCIGRFWNIKRTKIMKAFKCCLEEPFEDCKRRVENPCPRIRCSLDSPRCWQGLTEISSKSVLCLQREEIDWKLNEGDTATTPTIKFGWKVESKCSQNKLRSDAGARAAWNNTQYVYNSWCQNYDCSCCIQLKDPVTFHLRPSWSGQAERSRNQHAARLGQMAQAEHLHVGSGSESDANKSGATSRETSAFRLFFLSVLYSQTAWKYTARVVLNVEAKSDPPDTELQIDNLPPTHTSSWIETVKQNQEIIPSKLCVFTLSIKTRLGRTLQFWIQSEINIYVKTRLRSTEQNLVQFEQICVWRQRCMWNAVNLVIFSSVWTDLSTKLRLSRTLQ